MVKIIINGIETLAQAKRVAQYGVAGICMDASVVDEEEMAAIADFLPPYIASVAIIDHAMNDAECAKLVRKTGVTTVRLTADATQIDIGRLRRSGNVKVIRTVCYTALGEELAGRVLASNPNAYALSMPTNEGEGYEIDYDKIMAFSVLVSPRIPALLTGDLYPRPSHFLIRNLRAYGVEISEADTMRFGGADSLHSIVARALNW